MSSLLVLVSIIVLSSVIEVNSGCQSALTNLRKEEQPLFVPKLQDVAKVLQLGLKDTFKEVKVRVVDCPDLTKKPFSLAARGFGGNPTIVEVGSQFYLTPIPNRAKYYDIKDLPHQTDVHPTLIIGSGAGPYKEIGQACELIANVFIKNGHVHSESQISKMVKDDHVSQVLPDNVTGYSFTSHLYLSEGAPGKVLKIKVKQRFVEDSFFIAVRDSLRKGFPGKPIGMGGAVLMENSKIRLHVQGNFSVNPVCTDQDSNMWLNWFTVDSPLVAVGTLLTHDVGGFSLRQHHFHCMSEHNAAGHYYYDLEPDKVEYTAYFNIGHRVVRLDRPE